MLDQWLKTEYNMVGRRLLIPENEWKVVLCVCVFLSLELVAFGDVGYSALNHQHKHFVMIRGSLETQKTFFV